MTLRLVKDGYGIIVDRDSPAHNHWLARGYVEERAEDAPVPAQPWTGEATAVPGDDWTSGARDAFALAEALDAVDAGRAPQPITPDSKD